MSQIQRILEHFRAMGKLEGLASDYPVMLTAEPWREWFINPYWWYFEATVVWHMVSAATGYTLSFSRGPVIYALTALTMLAFAVTSLDSATKTLVNDTARLIEEGSSGKGVKRISREKILNTVTYSTMGILGVLNVILLITGFPKVFTILFCLIFVPFFIRAIVYTFKFAAGKADYSKSGTVTEEEYAIIKEQTKDFLYEADR